MNFVIRTKRKKRNPLLEQKEVNFYKTLLILFIVINLFSSTIMFFVLNLYTASIAFSSATLVFIIALFFLYKGNLFISVSIVEFLLPIIIIASSIISKLHGEGNKEVFFVAPRLALLLLIMLPMTVWGLESIKKLIITTALPAVGFIFFDIIHKLWGIEPPKTLDYYLTFLSILGLAIVAYAIIFMLQKTTEEYQEVIIKQKEEIKRAHNQVMQSIDYAQRIQKAVLQRHFILKQHFDEYFILLMPKETVSGDFYWIYEKEDKIFVLAGDCTGHGVPGMTLTMLAISFLNQIVSGSDKTAADIFEELRNLFISTLIGNSDMQDGMDAAMIIYHKKSSTINYCGTHNPLVLIRDDELKVFAPEKKSYIGKMRKLTNFQDIFFETQKGDLLYMFSDGYPDQFSEKKKKFGTKRFKELLFSLKNIPLPEQKQVLQQKFNQWKGQAPQIDDVLVIGLKI